MEIETIITKACELFNVEKNILLQKKRSTYRELCILVSIFFIADQYFEISYICKYMNKSRAALYYYLHLLRPNNNFFEYEPFITKLVNYIKND